MIVSPENIKNRLLASLPREDFALFSDSLELVNLPLGKMIYVPDQEIEAAYFPCTSIISLHYITESGASAEMAGVGNEGILGVPIFMGGQSTSSSAVVQTAGQAYRLNRNKLLTEFNRAGVLQRLMLRYAQALMTQMAQTAVCNRHHSIEQQLCRWLLLTLDRLPHTELVMTQELVATMLGVRREGITEAAGNLRDRGLISYRRGHISVLDRGGLQRLCCECYEVVKTEMSRLL